MNNNKLYNILLVIGVLLYTFLSFSSCDSTESEVIKSPRDYTWTADTISYPGSLQTLMTSIYGVSENDIYICGHNNINMGQIFHFDGLQWSSIDEQIFNSVPQSPVIYSDVKGSSSDNVWAVGSRFTANPNPPPNFLYRSFIIQNNGISWVEHDLNLNTQINSVFVENKSSVWLSGKNGIVCKYDGIKWMIDTIRVPFERSELNMNSIAVYNKEVFILGNRIDLNNFQEVYYSFRGDLNKWLLIDSMRIEANNTNFRWGIGSLYTSSFNKLYSSGYGLFEWNNSSWEKSKKIVDNSIILRSVYGSSFTNLFYVGEEGVVLHWNGTDLYQFQEFKASINPLLFNGVWTNGKFVVLLANILSSSPQKSVVYFGQ